MVLYTHKIHAYAQHTVSSYLWHDHITSTIFVCFWILLQVCWLKHETKNTSKIRTAIGDCTSRLLLSHSTLGFSSKSAFHNNNMPDTVSSSSSSSPSELLQKHSQLYDHFITEMFLSAKKQLLQCWNLSQSKQHIHFVHNAQSTTEAYTVIRRTTTAGQSL